MWRIENAAPIRQRSWPGQGRLRGLLSGGALARLSGTALLFTGATLQGYELATGPALGVLYESQSLQAGLVEYESLLAIWLLSGFWAVYCRRLALATFAILACVALYRGLIGAASCGCFGRMHVSPCLVVGLDSTAMILLGVGSLSTPYCRRPFPQIKACRWHQSSINHEI
jgi:hypothetical protein